jgi:hypothetical protein
VLSLILRTRQTKDRYQAAWRETSPQLSKNTPERASKPDSLGIMSGPEPELRLK